MAPSKQKKVQDAVVRTLSGIASGQPASDVVKTVAEGGGYAPDDVRREVRTLLESGHITLGANLNLVATQLVASPDKKAG
jgi:hypothetical protein